MPSQPPSAETLAHHYTVAIGALCDIARSYYTAGRLANARNLLHTSLKLTEMPDMAPYDHQKLLLLYGQVLIVHNFLTHEKSSDTPAPILQQAQQIAESLQDQRGIADALSLLGQAQYFAVIVEHLANGTPLTSTPGDGQYDGALIFQQQALELREALHDTRGISESCFQVGVIYERWQQPEQALGYYMRASQIADQYGHALEKTEPARHLAAHAWRQGNLKHALPLALQALALREAAQFRPYLPLDHLLIREIYRALGDTANAQIHTEHAIALAEEMGLQRLVASVSSRAA
jgi:tetratricopeptide (TPR) repeat protein